MSFSEKDLRQIAQRGSDLSVINEQIENFKSGFPYMKVKRAATLSDGMIRLEKDEINKLTEFLKKNRLRKTPEICSGIRCSQQDV